MTCNEGTLSTAIHQSVVSNGLVMHAQAELLFDTLL